MRETDLTSESREGGGEGGGGEGTVGPGQSGLVVAAGRTVTQSEEGEEGEEEEEECGEEVLVAAEAQKMNSLSTSVCVGGSMLSALMVNTSECVLNPFLQ